MAARRGLEVVVHERFDTPRPVGSGLMLQPTGLAVLERLGLRERLAREGAVINRLHGTRAPDRRVVLDVRYGHLRRPEPAVAVHRASLFAALHVACVEEGVAFETGFEAVAHEAGAGRLIDGRGRRSAAFDLAVDASGARSVLQRERGGRTHELAFGALWATVPLPADGFGGDALEQVYRGAEKMIGVLPCGRGAGIAGPVATFFWSLKTEAYGAWRAAGLEAWKAEVRGLWPEVEPILESIDDPDQLVLARYAHRTHPSPVGRGMAVIGDAAHCTSPQLGQGVNMGLLDAWALDRALEAQPDLETALGVYAASRRLHVSLYQALSLAFTPFYQSDGPLLPWVRDHVLGLASRVPPSPRLLAATVAGLLLDPRRDLGLS